MFTASPPPQEAVSFDPSLTFWTYLLVRTVLGVLTAARC
jgi:hypothetical protein